MKRWDIRDLDCRQPILGLPEPADAAGVYLQLWDAKIPLGHLWISRSLLPMSDKELGRHIAEKIATPVGNILFKDGFRAPLAANAQYPGTDIPPEFVKLASISNPLAQARDQVLTPQAMRRISLIICTRNRPDSLHKCLESVSRLDPSPFEVIVVDNAPQDNANQNVVEKFPTVTYLIEPQAGLSRARNTGLKIATGDIIAWTDDDVVVPSGWLRTINEGFANECVSGVTGLVLASELETASQYDFECNRGGFNRGYRPKVFDSEFFLEMRARSVPVWTIGAGANMAFRREVFADVGVFDERLGAGASGCSEDSELWYRMLASGLTIRYEPRAFVWHTHRVDDSAFGHQMEQYMRGHVAALLIQFEKFHHEGNLRRLFLSLPRYYWKLCFGSLRHLRCPTRWAEIRGYFSGLIFYLRSRHRWCR